MILAMAAVIVGPFVVAGDALEDWTHTLLESAADRPAVITWGVIALLSADIVLPVPSSVLSTAAGFLLGFAPGLVASWAGMTLACLVGYGLGRSGGRWMAGWMLDREELAQLDQLTRRAGLWMLVFCRPVPVLAEASILFAGMSRFPLLSMLGITALANTGISAAYAAVGAYSAGVNSFLLACSGAILLPAVILSAARLLPSVGSRRV